MKTIYRVGAGRSCMACQLSDFNSTTPELLAHIKTTKSSVFTEGDIILNPTGHQGITWKSKHPLATLARDRYYGFKSGEWVIFVHITSVRLERHLSDDVDPSLDTGMPLMQALAIAAHHFGSHVDVEIDRYIDKTQTDNDGYLKDISKRRAKSCSPAQLAAMATAIRTIVLNN